MSEFAFFRFMSLSLLELEEQQHKDEIVSLTEEVLDAKGIECDSKVGKISEDQLKEILEQVRRLRKKRKYLYTNASSSSYKQIFSNLSIAVALHLDR